MTMRYRRKRESGTLRKIVGAPDRSPERTVRIEQALR